MKNHRLRAALAAVSVAALGGIGLASTAHAAAVPTAPYTEARLDGALGSSLLGSGSIDQTGANVTVSSAALNDVTFQGAGAALNVEVSTSDASFTAAKTYDTGSAFSADVNAVLVISASGRTCAAVPGTLTVHEVTASATAVTAFAASFAFSCDNGQSNVGELRWNSTVQHVAFGVVSANGTSDPQPVTVTPVATTTFGTATFGESSGHPYGENPFYPFRVATDTCSGKTIAGGATCTVTVTAHPTLRGGQFGELTLPTSTGTPVHVISLTSVAGETAEGTYSSVTPARLLDTRTSTGGGAFGAGVTRSLQVTGRGGVPTAGVGAAVLNVTVVSPTKAGNLVVYPSGTARPTASTVNFNTGWTGASLTTVRVGAGGKVDIRNATGSAHVVVDVVGYYRDATSTTASAKGGYFGVTPDRLIDTRKASDGPALGPNESVNIPVDFNDPSDPYDYNAHIKAFAVNVTAVGPTAAGHFTVWNGASTAPNASTLNFTKGRTAPNMAIVPAAACDFCGGEGLMFGVLNASNGSTHLIVDLVGYYDDDTFDGTTRFVPRSPTRIVDTRNGLGATTFAAGATKTVAAPDSVANLSTWSLVTTLTAAAPAQNASVTLWAAGSARPTTSNLNPYAGQYVSNMTITDLGGNNDFSMFTSSKGSTNLIVDVLGSMEHYPTLAPVSGAPVGVAAAAASDAAADAQADGSATLAPTTSDVTPRGVEADRTTNAG